MIHRWLSRLSDECVLRWLAGFRKGRSVVQAGLCHGHAHGMKMVLEARNNVCRSNTATHSNIATLKSRTRGIVPITKHRRPWVASSTNGPTSRAAQKTKRIVPGRDLYRFVSPLLQNPQQHKHKHNPRLCYRLPRNGAKIACESERGTCRQDRDFRDVSTANHCHCYCESIVNGVDEWATLSPKESGIHPA